MKYSHVREGEHMLIYGLIGSVIASFMYTLAQSKNINFLYRRSACNHCDRNLRWFELIPIISYVIQRGKCVTCNNRIPFVYLICEVILASLFLLPLIIHLQFDDIVMYYLLITFLIPIALYDFETYTIPNHMSLILLITGLAVSQLAHVNILQDFIAIVMLHVVYILFNESIGYGDIKLLCVIAIITPVNFVFYTFLLTFIIGGIFILTLFLYRKFVQEKVALAPFIATAAIVTFLVYEDLNSIYFGGFL